MQCPSSIHLHALASPALLLQSAVILMQLQMIIKSAAAACSPAKKMFRYQSGGQVSPTAGGMVESAFNVSPVGREPQLGSPLTSPRRSIRKIPRAPFKVTHPLYCGNVMHISGLAYVVLFSPWHSTQRNYTDSIGDALMAATTGPVFILSNHGYSTMHKLCVCLCSYGLRMVCSSHCRYALSWLISSTELNV